VVSSTIANYSANTLASRLVFAHFDFHLGNILRNNATGQLQVIDFEGMTYVHQTRPAGMDMAHIRNRIGRYLTQILNPESSLIFAEAYMQEMERQHTVSQTLWDQKLQQFRRALQVFDLLDYVDQQLNGDCSKDSMTRFNGMLQLYKHLPGKRAAVVLSDELRDALREQQYPRHKFNDCVCFHDYR
jgi:hypothetical protein